MKKFSLTLMAGLMILSLLVGCAKQTNEETVIDENGSKIATEQSHEESKTGSKNPLTGLMNMSATAVGMRPVAVMVNNSKDSLPQYGVSEADVIFELPVEGDITRLMAVYADYTLVPDICSVRSCRYYYPILASGLDAFYVYWGQDETIATEVLNSMDIDQIDGMENTYGLFSRDENREAGGYAQEHTGVFDGTKFVAAAKDNDLRLDKDGSSMPFNFAEETAEGETCEKIQIPFGGSYTSGFVYDAEKKVYKKDHSGDPHMDVKTKEQLAFTNLFLLETDIYVRDDVGRKEIDLTEGEGLYVTHGKEVRIRWKRTSDKEPIQFIGANDKEIPVQIGKSYIGFTNTGNLDL